MFSYERGTPAGSMIQPGNHWIGSSMIQLENYWIDSQDRVVSFILVAPQVEDTFRYNLHGYLAHKKTPPSRNLP